MVKKQSNIVDIDDFKLIIINEEITAKTAVSFGKAIEYFKRKDLGMDNAILNVYINTPGGKTIPTAEITNLILSLIGEMTICGIANKAYSAGNAILQGCHFREILPKGSLYIHRTRHENNGRNNIIKSKESEDSILNLFSLRTKKPKEEITQIADKKTLLNAKEALAHNWVDRVIEKEEPVLQQLMGTL